MPNCLPQIVAAYIPAAYEHMYFPTCSPTSAIIDSFNFANLTGEIVFVFLKNCIPLTLMRVSIFYYINWPSSLQVYPLYILYSFSPISEEETPLCWCPKRINFLRLPFFLSYLLSLASSIFLSSQIYSSWVPNVTRLQLFWNKRLY